MLASAPRPGVGGWLVGLGFLGSAVLPRSRAKSEVGLLRSRGEEGEEAD